MTSNRATRRREEAKRRGREAIWRRLIEQSGGCCRITIWRVGGALPDAVACAAIFQWIHAVATGELDPLCQTCDARPTPLSSAFAILAPAVDRQEALTVSAICPACAARSDSDLIEAAAAALKRDIFPGARRLDSVHMQHAGGRA